MENESARFLPFVAPLQVLWEYSHARDQYRALEGTMVFADGSGFTSLTERLAKFGRIGAEDMSALLNHYFDRLLSVAAAEGGELLKFGGDAVLLWFSGAHHQARACRAARAMMRSVRQAQPLQTAAGRARMTFSVGIHSGIFDFFLVGDRHRELIVTGPAVSRAIEMEGIADGGEVIVSPEVAATLPGSATRPWKDAALLLAGPPRSAWSNPEVPVETDLARCVPEAWRDYAGATSGEGEHRLVTTAFISFGGIDTLLRDHGPDETAQRLANLVTVTQEAAAEFGVAFLASDVNKDGGKLILTAGAPVATGADEEAMLLALRRVAEAGVPLDLKIGAASGPVFAGDIGASFRRAFTVIGDAVNLAARVMSRAGPGQVLATGAVLRRSLMTFETEALEPFAVKGKSQLVQAAVVGRPLARRTEPLRPDFVDREPELARARECFDDLRDGTGGVLAVTGELGIGKSRFIEEMLRRNPGFPAFTGPTGQYASRTPYFPFRNLTREVAGIAPDVPASDAAALLRQKVTAVSPQLVAQLPLIGTVADLPFDETDETRSIGPAFRPERTRQAMVDILTALAPAKAVLIFDETLQMDAPSRELVGLLGRLAPGRGWLLVVTSPHFDEDLGLDNAVHIELPPLPPSSSEQLAGWAQRELHAPESVITAARDKAGGNPLFLLELSRASAEDNLETLPETIEALVEARLDALARVDRRAVLNASILGATFASALFDEAFGSPSAEAHDLERVVDFFQREGSDFRFRNRVFRDVAYESIPFRRRRELHGLVLEVLEEQERTRPTEVELLALHAERSGNLDATWRWCVAAGRVARQKYANREAAAFLEAAIAAATALGTIDRTALADAQEVLGDVLDLDGQYYRALRAYDRARHNAADPAVARRTMRKVGLMHERVGQYRQAIRWLNRAHRHADSVDPDTCTALAGVRFRQGNYREAMAWARQGIDAARSSGDRSAFAHGCYVLGMTSALAGVSLDLDYLDLALATYEELGDFVGQGNCLNNLGNVAFWAGDWQAALDYWRRSRVARDKSGDVVGAATADHNIAEILLNQGHLHQALALLNDTLAVFQARAYRLGESVALLNLVRAHAKLGNLTAAESTLQSVSDVLEQVRASTYRVEVALCRAELALLGGDHARARDLAGQIRHAHQHGEGLPGATDAATLHIIARALPASEDRHGAFRDALDAARATGQTFMVGEVLHSRRTAGLELTAAEFQELEQIRTSLGVVAWAEPAPALPDTALERAPEVWRVPRAGASS